MPLILRCGPFEVPLENLRYLSSPSNVAGLTFQTLCPSMEASPQLSLLFRGSFLLVLSGLHQTHTVWGQPRIGGEFTCRFGAPWGFLLSRVSPSILCNSDNPKLLLWFLRPARLWLSVLIPSVQCPVDWECYLGKSWMNLGLTQCDSHPSSPIPSSFCPQGFQTIIV